MTECTELLKLEDGKWRRYFYGGPTHYGSFEGLAAVQCFGCGVQTPVALPPETELYLSLRCAGCDAPIIVERTS